MCPNTDTDRMQEYGAHDSEVVAGDAGDPVVATEVQQIRIALKKKTNIIV